MGSTGLFGVNTAFEFEFELVLDMVLDLAPPPLLLLVVVVVVVVVAPSTAPFWVFWWCDSEFLKPLSSRDRM